MPRSLLALLALLLLPLAAFAHGMSLDARAKGNTVTVSVFYDDDTPSSEAKVKVFNAAKEVILEGTTDEKGEWSFPAPPPGEYTVRATSDGHAAKGSFTISDTPPPADAPPERASARPPRLLLLGGGLLVVTAVFAGWYWLSRKRRGGPSVE